MRVIVLSLFLSMMIIFNGCGEKSQDDKQTISSKHSKDTLSFITIPNNEQSITIQDKSATLKNDAKITLIYLFSSKCFICKKNLFYLEKLKERYEEDIAIYIFGINENIEDIELSNTLAQYSKTLYISFDKENQAILDTLLMHNEIKELQMPLSLLYIDGKLYTHYQGITPIEMIETDIKYLLR
jgi:hypothetical protein